MKKLLTSTCFIGISIACTAAGADTLPLTRVVISTSGVALFEHNGTVTGDTDLALPVRLDQVDDVLKSLVVLDDTGKLGGITLPGREPLSQSFRDLPFSRADLNSVTGLLNALQGASVEIDGPSKVSGRLMNVVPEIEETEGNGHITRNRVSVMTAEGVKTAILERLDALRFTETSVQAQVSRALEAIYSNRIKDQRQLNISLRGAGQRPVSLAYVETAPLWKSAYRLVLPEQDAKEPKAFLQGWAVLENTTALDWKDVNVTLMSGSPVTYSQPLYESYYLPRPELPVKVMNRVMPRVDSGTLGGVEETQGYAASPLQEKADLKGGMLRGRAAQLGADKMASMEMEANYAAADASVAGMAAPAAMPPMPGEMAAAPMAIAEESSSQLVFAFPQPVTLPAGNTLMVPFVSRKLEAERLYLYQPDTNPQHPLAAVTLKNSGDSGLPPGILTLFDGTKDHALLHVGDAEMPLVPKDETRFISFALDAKTKIDRQDQQDRELGLISISKGVLYQKVLWRNTTAYTIKAPADEARTIVIEHPRLTDWELVKPEGVEGETEMTPTHYRLRVTVPAGKSKTLKVTLQRNDTESFSLVDISPYDLDTRFSVSGKGISAELRKVLEKLKTLRSAVAEQEAAINEINAKRQNIYNDQQRLRENLRTVSSNNDLGKRYLNQLNEQENALDRLNQDEAAATAKTNTARRALAEYVSGLTL